MIKKQINIDVALLKLLPTLIAVAETQNFREAAQRLGISQPAVTQQIRLLEAKFSYPLFRLLGRKKVLTKFGEDVYRTAQIYLEKLSGAVNIVQNKHADPSKAVWKIGGRPELLEYFLKNVRLQGKLECAFMSAKHAAESISKGEIDLAITYEKPDSNELYAKFAFKSFPVWAVSKTLFTSKLNPALLKKISCLSYQEDEPALVAFLKTMDLQTEDIKTKLVCEDWRVLRSLVEEGRGFAVLPDFVASSLSSKIYQMPLNSKLFPSYEYYFVFRRENKKQLTDLLKVAQFI